MTGGSRGIGAAIAKALGAQGARVVVNYAASAAKADEVAAEIAKLVRTHAIRAGERERGRPRADGGDGGRTKLIAVRQGKPATTNP